jgi:hypothetical protein
MYKEGLLQWADGDDSVLITADDLLTEGSLPRATPEYWGLRWRQRVGPAVCPYLQPIMLSAVHRRLRSMLWWRRWARQGI